MVYNSNPFPQSLFLWDESFETENIVKSEAIVEMDQTLESVRNARTIKINNKNKHFIEPSQWREWKFQRIDNIIYNFRNQTGWKVHVIKTDKENKNIKNKIALIDCRHLQILPSNNKCINFFFKIMSFLTNYAMLWALFADILLIINVYAINDYKFFV